MKYEVIGEPLAVLKIDLEAGESITCQSGAMSWMTDGLEMETKGPGGVGKLLGRMVTQENIFQNRYVASKPATIAFCNNLPGSIRAVEIGPGKNVIGQKGAYIASTDGVEMEIYRVKGLKNIAFGGEGMLLQQYKGEGIVFLEIEGHVVEYDLGPGEQITVSTGHMAMMDETCTMEAVTVKGMKNKLLGGEGFFNTIITGPGKVMLQSMPLRPLAERILKFMPQK